MTAKEDFASGTDAAAAGGVTTVLDMPNTSPPVVTAADLVAKRELVEPKARVDFGLFGLFSEQVVDEIGGLVDAGACALKLFMGQTTGDNVCPEDDVVLEGLIRAAELGIVVGAHAENDRMRRVLVDELQRRGRCDPIAHLESRPSTIEGEAVARLTRMARLAGAHVHIHHLSSADGLAEVERARLLGGRVSCESLVGHLLLDDTAYDRLGNLVKLNPPIRPASDVAALWDGLDRGVIDCIATDHAPHEPEGQFEPDVWKATAGFIGVETMLPLLLTEVAAGRLSLPRLVELCCSRPAALFGLGDRKGAIAVGGDADLVLVDRERVGVVRGADLHSRHPITPYDGHRTVGAVEATLVRGAVVWAGGELSDDRPGQMVVPRRRPNASGGRAHLFDAVETAVPVLG
jgi:dihydroorotase